MRLPFDEDMAKNFLIGKTFVLSKNNASSPFFNAFLETEFQEDGEMTGIGRWEATGPMDGSLRILDKKGGLVYEFRTLEVRRGVVYMTGRNVLESSVSGLARTVMHRKVPLSNFGVCVSSHVEYEDVTVPRLLNSLRSDGFDMGRVMVVVGGDQKSNDAKDEKLGVRVVRCKKNSLGLTAMSGSGFGMAECPYWLLLHDTCDVVPGFLGKMSQVDVGLNPDVILLRPPAESIEIGLYSAQFIQTCGELTSIVKPIEAFRELIGKAELVQVLDTPFKKEPVKDIYGMGIRRETVVFSQLGIRKFKSKGKILGKP